MISISSLITEGLAVIICALLPTLSVHADGPSQTSSSNLQTVESIRHILAKLDHQIDQTDKVIALLEQQVEAHYRRIDTTNDYTTRSESENIASQLGEKLMQMQTLRTQLLKKRQQTEKLLHEFNSDK